MGINFFQGFMERLASAGWNTVLKSGSLIYWFIEAVFGVS